MPNIEKLYTDQPITLDRKNDIFGTLPKAKAMKAYFENHNIQKLLRVNNLVALYGDWEVERVV